MLALASPALTQAQYPPGSTGCAWSGRSVPVLFNPANIAAAGFDPDLFREALLNAMAVWNEESTADIDLYYAGDTTAVDSVPGYLIVDHRPTWDVCGGDDALAKAFYNMTPGTNCRSGGTIVHVALRDHCPPFAPRPWRTDWPGDGGSGGISYEAVLIHELGHVAIGIRDQVPQNGLMYRAYTRVGAMLHLYKNDVETAVVQDGATARRPATSVSSNGVTWGAVSALGGEPASVPPSVYEAIGDATWPLRAAFPRAILDSPRTYRVTHGSWSQLPSPPIVATGTTYGPVSIARSDGFNELMVAWLDSCNMGHDCTVVWAWSANNGASWTTGIIGLTTSLGAFGRVELAYDAARDRFVMAYLQGQTGRIQTTSSPAAAPSWRIPIVASPAGLWTERFRYMGGFVFDSSGTGLLTAGYAVTPVPVIVQMPVSVSGAGDYSLPSVHMANAADPYAYMTRRHFGIARRPSSGTIVLGWRGVDGARSFVTASKTSLSPSVAFGTPGNGFSQVFNGVDVAFVPSTNGFAAGVSW